MKRESRRQRLVAEINITPFTDVILVLLVIFMIATPLISQTNIKVKLPDAKSGQPIEAPKKTQVYVTVAKDGSIYLDHRGGEEGAVIYHRGQRRLRLSGQGPNHEKGVEGEDRYDAQGGSGYLRDHPCRQDGSVQGCRKRARRVK